jgi:hypothetical protein
MKILLPLRIRSIVNRNGFDASGPEYGGAFVLFTILRATNHPKMTKSSASSSCRLSNLPTRRNQLRWLNLNGGSWLNSYISYDVAGNQISNTDANSHTTHYSYRDAYTDGQNHYTYARLTSLTNAQGQTEARQYDYSTGNTYGP